MLRASARRVLRLVEIEITRQGGSVATVYTDQLELCGSLSWSALHAISAWNGIYCLHDRQGLVGDFSTRPSSLVALVVSGVIGFDIDQCDKPGQHLTKAVAEVRKVISCTRKE